MTFILSLLLSFHCDGHFSRWTLVSQYQNFSILDSVGAKGDGGGGATGNWSYKYSCKAPVKSSPMMQPNDVANKQKSVARFTSIINATIGMVY